MPGRCRSGIPVGCHHQLLGAQRAGAGLEDKPAGLPAIGTHRDPAEQGGTVAAGDARQLAHVKSGMQRPGALQQQPPGIALGRQLVADLRARQQHGRLLSGRLEHLRTPLQSVESDRGMRADEAAAAAELARQGFAPDQRLELVEGRFRFLGHRREQAGIQRPMQIGTRATEAAGPGQRAAVARGGAPADGLGVQHHRLDAVAGELQRGGQPGDAAADDRHFGLVGDQRPAQSGRGRVPPEWPVDEVRGEQVSSHRVREILAADELLASCRQDPCNRCTSQGGRLSAAAGW